MFKYEELIKKNRKITPIFKIISSEAADDEDEGFSFEDPNEEDTNEEESNEENNEEESDEGFSFDTSEGDDESSDEESEEDDGFSFGDDEGSEEDDGEGDDFSFGNDDEDDDSSKNNKSSVDPNEASIDTKLSELLREYVPKSISDLKVIVAKNLDIMKSCPYINDDIEYCIDKYNQAYDQMITKFIPRLDQIDDVSRLKFFVSYKSLFSKIAKAFVVSVQAEKRNK